MRRFVGRGRRVLREEGGFTLPEVMVTIMIMITVLFALYSIFDMSIRVFSFGNDKFEAVENARLGLEKMERELRAAYPADKAGGRNYLLFAASAPVATPPTRATLSSATATEITFGNDLDGNRKIECPNPAGSPSIKCEVITYRLGGNTLQRVNAYGGGTEAVVEFAKTGGLTFEYLKKDGTPISTGLGNDEGDVGAVRISLDVEIDRGSFGKRTQTLTTDVALRNRG